jgi:hypothetical protein
LFALLLALGDFDWYASGDCFDRLYLGRCLFWLLNSFLENFIVRASLDYQQGRRDE